MEWKDRKESNEPNPACLRSPTDRLQRSYAQVYTRKKDFRYNLLAQTHPSYTNMLQYLASAPPINHNIVMWQRSLAVGIFVFTHYSLMS